MSWVIEFHQDFEPEFDVLPEEVQNKLLARANLLETFGSELGRPHVDTLNGSRHSNMKEVTYSHTVNLLQCGLLSDSRYPVDID